MYYSSLHFVRKELLWKTEQSFYVPHMSISLNRAYKLVNKPEFPFFQLAKLQLNSSVLHEKPQASLINATSHWSCMARVPCVWCGQWPREGSHSHEAYPAAGLESCLPPHVKIWEFRLCLSIYINTIQIRSHVRRETTGQCSGAVKLNVYKLSSWY